MKKIMRIVIKNIDRYDEAICLKTGLLSTMCNSFKMIDGLIHHLILGVLPYLNRKNPIVPTI